MHGFNCGKEKTLRLQVPQTFIASCVQPWKKEEECMPA